MILCLRKHSDLYSIALLMNGANVGHLFVIQNIVKVERYKIFNRCIAAFIYTVLYTIL